MDNNELLQQILSAMNEQSEQIVTMLRTEIDTKIKESETRINIKLENEVTKRIDALVDGYKLNHEKQWELERRVEAIEQKLGIAV